MVEFYVLDTYATKKDKKVHLKKDKIIFKIISVPNNIKICLVPIMFYCIPI